MCFYRLLIFSCGHPGEKLLVKLCKNEMPCPPRNHHLVNGSRRAPECHKCRTARFTKALMDDPNADLEMLATASSKPSQPASKKAEPKTKDWKDWLRKLQTRPPAPVQTTVSVMPVLPPAGTRPSSVPLVTGTASQQAAHCRQCDQYIGLDEIADHLCVPSPENKAVMSPKQKPTESDIETRRRKEYPDMFSEYGDDEELEDRLRELDDFDDDGTWNDEESFFVDTPNRLPRVSDSWLTDFDPRADLADKERGDEDEDFVGDDDTDDADIQELEDLEDDDSPDLWAVFWDAQLCSGQNEDEAAASIDDLETQQTVDMGKAESESDRMSTSSSESAGPADLPVLQLDTVSHIGIHPTLVTAIHEEPDLAEGLETSKSSTEASFRFSGEVSVGAHPSVMDGFQKAPAQKDGN